MFKFLQQPYPFHHSFRRNITHALAIGLFVGLLNAVLADSDEIDRYLWQSKRSLSVFFGLITALNILIIFELFPRYCIPVRQKENWTVSKEFGILVLLLLFILFSNYGFLILVSKSPSTFLSLELFLNMFLTTFIIGLVPTSLVIWKDYTLKLKENLKQVELHNQQLKETLLNKKEKTEECKVVSIPSGNKGEIIQFEVNQLLFIRSEGNYIELFLRQNQEVLKKIYRASLQTLEADLQGFPHLIRTHRSYIVNVREIRHTQGNARNYQLFFDQVEDSVPVARSRFQQFNEALRNVE
ncbi:LytTR family DNA-binding domain-containing protein [Rapidithrix thailandica]|uniref:LytTR family DNA-binding domain-containing protein n=1 Tax=Rapidithrix thailandica TaxID=413964 RepID=A0AAW9S3X4_9BACT